MRLSTVCLLAAALELVVAGPLPNNHVLHEKRSVGPFGSKWVKRGRVESTEKLPMRVGLQQSNLDIGDELLMKLSHPTSEHYGKYLTSDEVIEVFQPAKESVDSVIDWLVKVGGIARHRISHSANKQWLAFDATAAEAESLLHTEYHVYEHETNGVSQTACDEYHVPKAVQRHIDYITPGIKGSPRKRDPSSSLKKRSRVPKKDLIRPAPEALVSALANGALTGNSSLATCDIAITPACLQALYGFSAPDPNCAVSQNNSLGIFEDGDVYAQADLDYFFGNFSLPIPAGTHPVLYSIDGGDAPATSLERAGDESALDFQLAYPIVYPQTITLYQTDDENVAEDWQPGVGLFNTFLDAIDGSYCTYSAFGETGNSPIDPQYPDNYTGGYNGSLMCGVYNPTNVLSLSYSVAEGDLPASYEQRQCNEWMKLGLQGVSVLFSSGDAGVGSYHGEGYCLGRNESVFSPSFPSTCPYVTTVGATKIQPGKTVNDPEIAAHDPSLDWSTGGGFSNVFTSPSYQSDAVATYFATSDPGYPYYTNGGWNTSANTNHGVYNRNGRGFPDVSANGDNDAVYTSGYLISNGGTSASTPIFASLINRIIEERIKVGKGPLGFLNPTLYSNPQVLNDITSGNNPNCGSEGFHAATGWDPVTGLGTPNYPKMLDLFLSLP